jgi:hypothetical protein
VRRVCVPGGALRALGRIGDALQRIRPFDFPLSSEATKFATLWPGAESSPALKALGIGFRDPNETLGDTLRWLHAASHLEGRVVGRLAAR